MPHEAEGQVHWHEPLGLSPAGLARYRRPALAYDRFMAQEGIPVVRQAHVASLIDLERAAWRRLGGRGAFVQPFGTEGGLGCAVIELPPSAGLRPEKHLFEEIVFVLQGRGTTELWLDRAGERVRFEWQAGSLFSIPANALHRMVNATQAPALLLSVSNAPALINQLGDVDAVFANPYVFADRFDAETGQAFDDVEPDPVRELALCRTTLVPDAIGCDLPLDNRHSPGYRQLALGMTGPALCCTLGEHRPGRYGRARLLEPATALVCVRGGGVMTLWPERAGPTPWQDGAGDAVLRFDHAPGCLAGAGPGGGRWYHQLFTTSAVPMRHLVVSAPDRPLGPPGEELAGEDPSVVPYWREDPGVRTVFASWLPSGVINRMRPDDYAPPDQP